MDPSKCNGNASFIPGTYDSVSSKRWEICADYKQGHKKGLKQIY